MTNLITTLEQAKEEFKNLSTSLASLPEAKVVQKGADWIIVNSSGREYTLSLQPLQEGYGINLNGILVVDQGIALQEIMASLPEESALQKVEACVSVAELNPVFAKLDNLLIPPTLVVSDLETSPEDFLKKVEVVARKFGFDSAEKAYFQCSDFSLAVFKKAQELNISVSLFRAPVTYSKDLGELKAGDRLNHIYLNVEGTFVDYTARQIDASLDFPLTGDNYLYPNSEVIYLQELEAGLDPAGWSFYFKELSKQFSKTFIESNLRDEGMVNGHWGTSASGILFKNDDHILLLKRASWCSDPDTWGLPGGAIPLDETGEKIDAFASALRECKEEIGLATQDLVAQAKTVFVKGSFTYTTFVVEAEEQFVPELNEEHTDYKWFKLSDIPLADDIHPGIIPMLEQLNWFRTVEPVVGKGPVKKKPLKKVKVEATPGEESKEVTTSKGLRLVLEKQEWGDGIPLEKLDPEEGHSFKISALHNGKEIGYVLCYSGGGRLYAFEVDVQKKYQRKGVATEMYNWAQELSNMHIYPHAYSPDNEEPITSDDAIQFWKSRGVDLEEKEVETNLDEDDEDEDYAESSFANISKTSTNNRKPLSEYASHPDFDNIKEWVEQHNHSVEDVTVEEGVIPKEEKATLQYWLNSKLKIEGQPDWEHVDEIGKSGKIEVPVVIDSDRDYTIDGRHRLAAALKYNLDCPVLDIIFGDPPGEDISEGSIRTEAAIGPTQKLVLNSIPWQDNYYDLYPGFSKKKDLDEEYYFDSKGAAIQEARELVDMFSAMPNPIPVFRALHAKSIDKVDVEHPGWSWSWSERSARSFVANTGIQKPWFLLKGFAPKKDVDWNDTVKLYYQFSGASDGESENEIRIRGNKVKNITVEQFDTVIPRKVASSVKVYKPRLNEKQLAQYWYETAYADWGSKPTAEELQEYLDMIPDIADYWELQTLNTSDIEGHHEGHDASEEYIADYAKQKKEGSDFPPIIVTEDEEKPGKYKTVDGFHRLSAAIKNGETTIRAYVPVGDGPGEEDSVESSTQRKTKMYQSEYPAYQFEKEVFNDIQLTERGSEKGLKDYGEHRTGHAYGNLPMRANLYLERFGIPDWIYKIVSIYPRRGTIHAVYCQRGKDLIQIWNRVNTLSEYPWKTFEAQAYNLGYSIKRMYKGKIEDSHGYWLTEPVQPIESAKQITATVNSLDTQTCLKTSRQVPSLHGKSAISDFTNWTPLTSEHVAQEYEGEYKNHTKHRYGNVFPTLKSFRDAVAKGKVIELPEDKGNEVGNRTYCDSIEELKDITSQYQFPRDVDRIVNGFETNDPIPYPILLNDRGDLDVMSGNIRLNAAYILGITPKVLVIDLPTEKRAVSGIEDTSYPYFHVSDWPQTPTIFTGKKEKATTQRAEIEPYGIFLFPKNDTIEGGGYSERKYRWDAKLNGAKVVELYNSQDLADLLKKAKVNPLSVLKNRHKELSYYKHRIKDLEKHLATETGKDIHSIISVLQGAEVSGAFKKAYKDELKAIQNAWESWLGIHTAHQWAALLTHFSNPEAATVFLRKYADVLNDTLGGTVFDTGTEPQLIVLNPKVVEWGPREKNVPDQKVYKLG